jgi:phage gp36-like protein
MDIQNRFRLNAVVTDILTIEHLMAIDKLNERDALRNFNKAFDALIDIRYDCPDEDVEEYVARVWKHIEQLSGMKKD